MTRVELALEFPFTSRDTPELRSRVRRDLERVWRDVRARDPAAETLVLTGGFSRGEGSALGARPLNDYDLVVVRRKPFPLARNLYPLLRARLSEALGLHVDLHAVSRARLPFLGPKVFWFDAKHGGREIAGARGVLARVPGARIARAEAARLLANRAVGLLEALPGPDGVADATLARQQAAKGALAAADAELVLAGRYHHLYVERLARVERLAKERGLAPDLVAEARWATAFKLDPAGPAGSRDPAEAWEAARRVLLATAETALPRAGWGPLAEYPRRAPASLVDVAVALSRGARAWKPSHAARAAGFRLLARARWPDGASGDDAVERLLGSLGVRADPSWPGPLDALARARARTLQ